MTIATTTNKVVGLGNGANANWPFTFIIPNASQLSVYYTDAAGNQTLVAPGNYSVAGLGNPNGGSVTYPFGGPPPVAAGTSVTVLRTVTLQQLTDITNQGGFYPEVYEAALDYLTMEVQQLNEQLGRAFKASIDATGDQVVSAAAWAARASLMLGFDATGALTIGTPFQPGSSPSFAGLTLTGALANSVLYTNGAKALTTVAGFGFDGTNLTGPGSITAATNIFGTTAVVSKSGIFNHGQPTGIPLQFQTIGGTQFEVVNTNSAVNFVGAQGGATGFGPNLTTDGTDANVELILGTKGTGGIRLTTGPGQINQFVVSHTAGATRYVQATGSNGGNPTIGTSAGELAINPANTSGYVLTGGAGNTVELLIGGATKLGAAGYNGIVMNGAAAAGSFIRWKENATDRFQILTSGATALFQTLGAAGFQFSTNTGNIQMTVPDTPGATRALQLTGSNGGNPSITVSAGGLDISAATLRFTGVGTTASVTPLTIINSVGSNDILRSTSTRDSKSGIQPFGIAEAEHVVLNADWCRYESLCAADDPNAEYIGLTAEHMATVDARFVHIDKASGKPDAVAYPALIVPLGVLVRELWQDYKTRTAH